MGVMVMSVNMITTLGNGIGPRFSETTVSRPGPDDAARRRRARAGRSGPAPRHRGAARSRDPWRRGSGPAAGWCSPHDNLTVPQGRVASTVVILSRADLPDLT